MVIKKLKKGTVGDLKMELNKALSNDLAEHVFNIRQQFREYKNLKPTLEDSEAILHIDFSKNYNCHSASEIQSAHFSACQIQATLHTGVLYLESGLMSFATISNLQRHDAATVWAHLTPILANLRHHHPEVSSVHL